MVVRGRAVVVVVVGGGAEGVGKRNELAKEGVLMRMR